MLRKEKKSSEIHNVKTHSNVDSDSESQEEDMKTWPVFTLTDSRKKCKEMEVLVLMDGKSVKMEVDTGAVVSIMPENVWRNVLSAKFIRKSNVRLQSYSGHEVPVRGEVDVCVEHGKQKAKLPIVITQNKGPVLLGRNWLTVLKLNWSQIKQVVAKPVKNVEQLIIQYASLFDNSLGQSVPFALKDKVKEEIYRLEKLGVLEKVEFSDWATPIVPVLKPDGSVRICGDYKVTINQSLDIQEYPMPTAEELFPKLRGGEKFSKIDLSAAYQQVVLDEESQRYVTINTHLGVGGILDDLIITGKNDEEHLRNLERALKRLQNMGIKLTKSKCVFWQPSVEYFAFVVDRQGIHPSPRKVQAIREVPTPENPTELKSFLGLVNYYRKFIPNMAKLFNPLNCLLSQEVTWKWSEECQKSFETLKVLLETAPVLTHYDPKKPVRLATDASSCGIGAVLSNVSDEGEEQPIAYASRTLSSSEQNYSMIEKEALAIIFGLKKFHQYVYGRRFSLITDHKPLTMILGPKRGVPVLAVSRLQRWAIQLGAYQYDIEYRTSKNNANVDALSRLPRKSVEEPDEWEEEAAAVNSVQLKRSPVSVSMIREATQKDSVWSRVVYYLLHGRPEGKLPEELQYFFTKQDEFTVEEGCLLRGTRVVIPTKYQGVVLSELHINHPGMVRMKSLARLHVWWSTLDQDIEQTVRDCTSCQFNRCKSPLKVNYPWIIYFNKKVNPKDISWIMCNYCGFEQGFQQHCIKCKKKLADYFCGECRVYDNYSKDPYHCVKCGVCRTKLHKSFHCDTCGMCFEKEKGKNQYHICKKDSVHDQCMICFEDTLTEFGMLKCEHKIHLDCLRQLLLKGFSNCPIADDDDVNIELSENYKEIRELTKQILDVQIELEELKEKLTQNEAKTNEYSKEIQALKDELKEKQARNEASHIEYLKDIQGLQDECNCLN
ncbi:uncharacterized protein K02A2.6-like [Xenia sp. Carnegie-2017]|uniref:uncharacterized protein K02A2.6-like n=1 Tax=Xenia sp. Carnegie-2017 TaxID=2897299 RepID=UPI001F04719B|nr:uncharacterized protein K02A2.6-like [Xenia sp. Carnegie-2017]